MESCDAYLQKIICFVNIIYVSQCVVESPVPPADLIVLSLGYKVLPDLATVPPALWYVQFMSAMPATSL